MTDDEKRELETQLLVRGFSGLEDPHLIPYLAALITDHEDFVGAMSEVDECKRQDMYDSMRPHLKFKAKPLHWYESRLYERASAGASRWAPIEIGDKAYQPVPQDQATSVVVTFTCSKCTRVQSFANETVVSAVIDGRTKGWVRDMLNSTEICPKCPAIRTKYGRA